MRYRNAIMILGFLIIVIQRLGFSVGVKDAISTVAALAVIALAYLAGKPFTNTNPQ